MAMGEGPIMDRLRAIETEVSNVALFNLDDIPPHLRDEFTGLHQDLLAALKARSFDGGNASELAGRIWRLYENLTELEQTTLT